MEKYKPIILAITFVVLTCVCLFVQQGLQYDSTRASAASVSVNAVPVAPVIQERVIDLPEISGNWYFTVVYGSPVHSVDQQLRTEISQTPRLQSLVSQTTFNEWDNDTRYLRHHPKWQSWLGSDRPAVLLQKPVNQNSLGNVIYYASGTKLPLNGDVLADQIAVAIDRHVAQCSDCRPRPRPEPAPAPQPPVTPGPTVIPQITPVQPAEPEGGTSWYWYLVPALSLLGGAGLQARRDV